MLERNRLQPPRPSSPSSTVDWSDTPLAAGCSGLFASPEDFDATGILAGVDPYESRYWWMPELFTSLTSVGETAVATNGGESAASDAGRDTSGLRRSGLAERLLRAGQATRRAGSRSPAAA